LASKFLGFLEKQLCPTFPGLLGDPCKKLAVTLEPRADSEKKARVRLAVLDPRNCDREKQFFHSHPIASVNHWRFFYGCAAFAEGFSSIAPSQFHGTF
jgi:hypothetical protein